jgi:hypothetical protein
MDIGTMDQKPRAAACTSGIVKGCIFLAVLVGSLALALALLLQQKEDDPKDKGAAAAAAAAAAAIGVPHCILDCPQWKLVGSQHAPCAVKSWMAEEALAHSCVKDCDEQVREQLRKVAHPEHCSNAQGSNTHDSKQQQVSVVAPPATRAWKTIEEDYAPNGVLFQAIKQPDHKEYDELLKEVPFPVSLHMFQRSRARIGNVTAIRAVIAKASGGGSVSIAVVGGSNTLGRQCNSGEYLDWTEEQIAACTWSEKFVAWLKQKYTKATIVSTFISFVHDYT